MTTPSGRVATTIWPKATSPLNQLWIDVLAAADVQSPQHRLPPALDFPRTASGLATLLELTGLESVAVQKVSWTFRVKPDDLWHAVEGGIATIGATYQLQDQATRASMLTAYLDLVQPRSNDGVLELPSVALLATGARPG